MERVKEVMVHVTGSTLKGNENSSSTEPLMRPQDQIEADVKRALSDIPEITGNNNNNHYYTLLIYCYIVIIGISHFLVHYDSERRELSVHLDLVVDNAKKVSEVKSIFPFSSFVFFFSLCLNVFLFFSFSLPPQRKRYYLRLLPPFRNRPTSPR